MALTYQCTDCQEENFIDSEFCNHCGKRLFTDCTKCGWANKQDSFFCSKCGGPTEYEVALAQEAEEEMAEAKRLYEEAEAELAKQASNYQYMDKSQIAKRAAEGWKHQAKWDARERGVKIGGKPIKENIFFNIICMILSAIILYWLFG